MTNWKKIPPRTLHESQDFELRFVEWPALDTVDRAEEVTAEFGEEIFDLIAGLLTLRALKQDKSAQTQLMLASARDLFMSKATGKTLRRYMVDYFSSAKVERNDGEHWIPLVYFLDDEHGNEASTPNVDGLGSMNLGITTGLLWHLCEVHFGPLFVGRLSKAAGKVETSSSASSPLEATG